MTGVQTCALPIFSLNKFDSLKAVDIYFAPVVNVPLIMNSSYVIWVWNDNSGVPGDSVYADTVRYPEYLNNEFQNAFQRDTLLKAVALNPGTYYVGFQQTGNTPLNVGFDRNFNHRDHMFYNTNGTWANSSFDGSYMIRPVFKKLDLGTRLEEMKSEEKGISIFPNPADEFISIHLFGKSSSNEFDVVVHDLSGRKVLQQRIRNHEKVSTTSLAEGIYILKINSSSEVVFTKTIVITK